MQSRSRTPVPLTAACCAAVLVAAALTTGAAPPDRAPTGPANPGFDGGDLSGWTVVSGDAFGPRSVTSADRHPGGAFGQRGSHHLWGSAAAGEQGQGELRSSAFRAPQRMSFLIGGGWDPKHLYAALVRDSDGRELARQTGPDDEEYVRVTWNTARWQGQQVHLRLVDRRSRPSKDGLAHLNLDDVRTTDPDAGPGGHTYNTLGQANQPATPDRSADPLRPQFHYTPYQGWINDPNGLVQWRGRHQLFSQFNPHAPRWGPMHWSHAEGPDAVHWRDRPTALHPNPPATPDDESGIFSGSAVDDHGTLTVAYTRNTDTRAHPGATPETVELATSRDGVNFRPVPGNPVVGKAPKGSGAGFRDPKLFRDPQDGTWKMLVGSGDHGRGKVHQYRSKDLRHWTYTGVLAEGPGEETGAMWECPDLFRLDGRWVLLYSTNEGGRSIQRYAVGSYDGTRFHAERHGTLDGGGDLYAGQSYRADDGRRLLTGWLADWNTKQPTSVNGWAGAQSLHRELFLTGRGTLGQRPVRETRSLTEGPPAGTAHRQVGAQPLPLGSGTSARLRAQLDLRSSTADTVTVRLRSSAAEGAELRYRKSTGKLTLDTRRAGYGPGGVWSTTAHPDAQGRLSLDVLIDRSSVEAFTGDGASLTGRVYPRYRESRDVSIAATGGRLHLTRATLTPLGSSWRK